MPNNAQRTAKLAAWRAAYRARSEKPHEAVNHAGWEVQDYTDAAGWKAATKPLPTTNATERIQSLIAITTDHLRIQESLTERTK